MGYGRLMKEKTERKEMSGTGGGGFVHCLLFMYHITKLPSFLISVLSVDLQDLELYLSRIGNRIIFSKRAWRIFSFRKVDCDFRL